MSPVFCAVRENMLFHATPGDFLHSLIFYVLITAAILTSYQISDCNSTGPYLIKKQNFFVWMNEVSKI